ncbi:MAG: hypothetical protein H0X36_08905 [Sphingomonadaceae bacterium]|nr:hypothetical protein [Sphingomonadaceae bacterium]
MSGFACAAACAVMAAAPAQANCWKADDVRAAKVRDLDTMLMVSALRCRLGDTGLLERYNAYVVQDRAALTDVNNALHAHFAAEVGKAKALDAYDNYVTAVANSYGAGVTGLSCADMGSIVDAAMAEGASYEALSAIAERANVQPRLEGGACEAPMTIAALP